MNKKQSGATERTSASGQGHVIVWKQEVPSAEKVEGETLTLVSAKYCTVHKYQGEVTQLYQPHQWLRRTFSVVQQSDLTVTSQWWWWTEAEPPAPATGSWFWGWYWGTTWWLHGWRPWCWPSPGSPGSPLWPPPGDTWAEETRPSQTWGEPEVSLLVWRRSSRANWTCSGGLH